MYADEELLALSGLQHLAYCERQWALIHLEQQWADNLDTVRGELFHERADTKGYSSNKGVYAIRSLRLVSYRLGITGVADIVEFVKDNQGVVVERFGCCSLVPIEYKVGKPKIEEWDRLQVCAQALCLEEMFNCSIGEGALFYGKTRHREKVPLKSQLREQVVQLSQRMHELFDMQKTPQANKTQRCRRCSLGDLGLPESGDAKVRAYWQSEGFLLGETSDEETA